MRAGRKRLVLAAVVAVLAVAAVVATAIATSGKNVSGHLNGYEEVPAISTAANGSFTARLARGGESIQWTLTYSGLEANATQAHIHFGQRDVAAGISVWLCSNLNPPPAAQPAGLDACPLRAGTVEGVATAEDVVGPTAQGIGPGELGELVRAIRRGLAYANVHSTLFPTGEIRAQLRPGKGAGRSSGKQRGRGNSHR